MSNPEPIESPDQQPHSSPCYQCSSGVLHLRFITYFTWLNEELITVPNFPAWICDVCGRREYDEKAIAWLSAILNPDAGHSTTHKRVTPPARPRPASRPPSPDRS